MIDNYLDWVKRRRRWYVKSGVILGRRSREVADDWSRGFYKGLAMAYLDSGRNFKRLQKDIEARAKPDKYGNSWGVVDIRTGDRLSD